MPYSELSYRDRGTPNYYSLVLKLAGGEARRVGQRMSQWGVVSDTYRFGGKLLPELPVSSPFATVLPNASSTFDEILTVPTHQGLAIHDRERILEAVERSLTTTELS